MATGGRTLRPASLGRAPPWPGGHAGPSAQVTREPPLCGSHPHIGPVAKGAAGPKNTGSRPATSARPPAAECSGRRSGRPPVAGRLTPPNPFSVSPPCPTLWPQGEKPRPATPLDRSPSRPDASDGRRADSSEAARASSLSPPRAKVAPTQGGGTAGHPRPSVLSPVRWLAEATGRTLGSCMASPSLGPAAVGANWPEHKGSCPARLPTPLLGRPRAAHGSHRGAATSAPWPRPAPSSLLLPFQPSPRRGWSPSAPPPSLPSRLRRGDDKEGRGGEGCAQGVP